MSRAMTTVPSPPRSGADQEPVLPLPGAHLAVVRAEQVDTSAPVAQAESIVREARVDIAQDPLRDTPLPVRTIALGLLGTVLIAAAGIGAAAVLEPDPLLNGTPFSWLRYGHGKQMATAVVFVGLALLIWSWIRLGRDVRSGQVDRRGMRIAIGAWVLPMLFTPPLFSRDMFSYLGQGDLALHGFDPYQFGVSVLNDHLSANVDPTWQNTPTPYGPLFVLLAKSVVLVTGQDTIVGVVAMRLTMCVGLVLLCWALPRLATRLGGSPTVALWLGAANPFVLTYLVGGGHNDLLMVGLLTSGTVLVLDGRHRKGFAVVTLAFAVKATAAVMLPFLVWIWAARLSGTASRRFTRAVSAALAVVLPVFGICTLAAGVNLGWLPALGSSSVVIEWLSLPTAVGQLAHLAASPFTTLDQQDFLSVTRTVGWLVLIALVARQWWLARDGDPATTIRRAAVALLVVALFSPATLPWYFSWALVVAAGVAWSGRGLVVAVFCSVWLVLMTFPDGSTALYDWGYLASAMVAAALAAVSLVRRDPLRLGHHPQHS
jgi:alpha-1,6-mannosyltransferase